MFLFYLYWIGFVVVVAGSLSMFIHRSCRGTALVPVNSEKKRSVRGSSRNVRQAVSSLVGTCEYRFDSSAHPNSYISLPDSFNSSLVPIWNGYFASCMTPPGAANCRGMLRLRIRPTADKIRQTRPAKCRDCQWPSSSCRPSGIGSTASPTGAGLPLGCGASSRSERVVRCGPSRTRQTARQRHQ
jgi:hypothetical protein